MNIARFREMPLTGGEIAIVIFMVSLLILTLIGGLIVSIAFKTKRK